MVHSVELRIPFSVEDITLGIFGGSFNPPHLGHINLCFEALETLYCKICIMPTYISPFKTDAVLTVSNEDRLKMASLAFAELPNVYVSDYEIKKEGISYTYLTVCHFLEKNPEEKICLIVGSDCLASLENWYNVDKLMEKVYILAAARDFDTNLELWAEYLNKKYGNRVGIMKYHPLEISSTQIRNMIVNGENLSSVLPSGVIEYIKNKGLYGGTV